MKIILHSNHCVRCRQLSQELQKKNITYEENNNIDEMIARGFAFLPVLEVDGVTMGFKDALKWIGEQ